MNPMLGVFQFMATEPVFLIPRQHVDGKTVNTWSSVKTEKVQHGNVRSVGGFMARIEGVSESETNDDVRQIFEEQKKRHGFVSNTAKIFALRPTVQKGVQALAQGIQESGLLTPELRNLVCVRAAQINGCPYWIDSNASGAMHNGAAAEKVEAVLGDWRKTPLFSMRERLALELAELMTYTGKRVTDKFFQRLKAFYWRRVGGIGCRHRAWEFP
jgi:AhpD family alkylhydroperoxidase